MIKKSPRQTLLSIANYVLKAITPKNLFHTQAKLFSKKALSKFHHIYIFSIGKAAKSMVQAIKPLLTTKPTKIFLADTGHPLPTKEGLKKTQKIIETAKTLTSKDLAIVLISGGGSAMFISPPPEITLNDKIQLTQKLLKSGATIQEMNTVRKQLSQVKGGRFAGLLYPATVWGFIISDVIGNDLSSIASGPISPNNTTLKDALKILKKYEIKPPKSILKYLRRRAVASLPIKTKTQPKSIFEKVTTTLLADTTTTIQKAIEKATQLHLKPVKFPGQLRGEARITAKKFIQYANKLPPNSLLIASGETTVTCKGSGFGGRNQEFVLSALPYLRPNQTILSIGTDGVDGITPKPVAGAIADYSTILSARVKKLKIQKFLQNNDSYTFFKKTGGHIKTGRTGTNLCDLALLLNFY